MDETEIGRFDCWPQWVNHAAGRTYPVGVVFRDALERVCRSGADFERARDEETFPVRYFFTSRASAGGGARLMKLSHDDPYGDHRDRQHRAAEVSRMTVLDAILAARERAAAFRHEQYEATRLGERYRADRCQQSAVTLEQFARDIEEQARG